MPRTPRRPANALDAAEALFKPSKQVAPAPAVERRELSHVKEQVSLKLDSEMLAYFQADGPGWQAHQRRAACRHEGDR